MRKVRGQALPLEDRNPHGKNALPQLVGTRLQVLLTPLIGVLFTFPSRY
jgi:hypothetical protein